MSTKEAALKVLKENKLDVESFQIELLQGRRPNPTSLGGFAFKSVGHVNLYLMAKRESDADTEYVEVNFMSDH